MKPQDEEGDLGIYPSEIAAMVYRRWHWILIGMLAGLAAAAAFASLSTPLYRSAATLLIDSPQIPSSLVASPVDVADERIAKIRQQMLSRDNLSGMIVRNNLFPDERGALPFPQVLDLMRTAIGVDLVSADQEHQGGSTIAFTISFTYPEAARAQSVTEQLTRTFLIEDKRFRTEQAIGTAAFLERRSEELRRQLRAFEDKRRDVESHYAGALPANMALSAQSTSAMRAEISRMDAETQGLAQQNSLLAARQQELDQAPPLGMDGLVRARDRLAQLAATYADDFPEVVAAQAEVRRQEEMLRQRTQDDRSNLIEMEIAAGRDRIGLLASRRAALVQSVAEMDRRLAQAPQAAYELTMIEREYDNIKRQYDSLRERQIEAEVAANLQSEDRGERFSIVDQPNLPTEPLGLKRGMVLAIGVVGGALLGLALIVAFELVAGTVHGVASLSRALQVPTFGVVPAMHQEGRGRLARLLPPSLRPAPAGPAGDME